MEVKSWMAPFIVIQDTREQAPIDWTGLTHRDRGIDVPILVPVTVKCLGQGDYSLQGCENVIAVERKSSADLRNTVAHSRERFVRELERLSELKHSFVLVESSWWQVMQDCKELSQYNPASLEASILSWQLKYPTHWLFRDNRKCAVKSLYKLFDLFWRQRPWNNSTSTSTETITETQT